MVGEAKLPYLFIFKMASLKMLYQLGNVDEDKRYTFSLGS